MGIDPADAPDSPVEMRGHSPRIYESGPQLMVTLPLGSHVPMRFAGGLFLEPPYPSTRLSNAAGTRNTRQYTSPPSRTRLVAMMDFADRDALIEDDWAGGGRGRTRGIPSIRRAKSPLIVLIVRVVQ